MLVYIVTVTEFYTSTKHMMSCDDYDKLLTVTHLSVSAEWMVWSCTEQGEPMVPHCSCSLTVIQLHKFYSKTWSAA